MHGFGALLWVVIVIAGVISSIVSTARKQSAARAPAFRPPPARPSPAPARVQTPAPARVQTPAPAPRPAARPAAPQADTSGTLVWPGLMQTRELAEPHKQATRAARWLGHRSALVRAVVASEVLGKPRALRDEI